MSWQASRPTWQSSASCSASSPATLQLEESRLSSLAQLLGLQLQGPVHQFEELGIGRGLLDQVGDGQQAFQDSQSIFVHCNPPGDES